MLLMTYTIINDNMATSAVACATNVVVCVALLRTYAHITYYIRKSNWLASATIVRFHIPPPHTLRATPFAKQRHQSPKPFDSIQRTAIMAWTKYQIGLALTMVGTGSINTLSTKYVAFPKRSAAPRQCHSDSLNSI